jgi:hypothetical protein
MSIDKNFTPTAPFPTIALFGANEQIGDRILHAFLSSKEHDFQIIAFIPPESSLQPSGKALRVEAVDLTKATRDELASKLQGVDAVISALNGAALESQSTIQDAAADAGVRRFYPSEYGFHQIYRKPNDPMGSIHPAWNLKARYVFSTRTFSSANKKPGLMNEHCFILQFVRAR